MLVLSSEQMKAIGEGTLRRFEDEMLAHFQGYAPELSRILKEERMRGVIRAGMARAAGHGFTQRGPVRLYLEMMFSLGSAFDSDPMLPWAARSLADTAGMQMQRAERLHAASARYFREVVGPKGEFALEALKYIHDLPFEALHGGTDEASIAALIRAGYPRKAAYAGEAALGILVVRARHAAQALGIGIPGGPCLAAALMFGFGHGVFSDPVYPWIGATLRREAIPDPGERLRQLFRKTHTYVEAMLKNLGP